MRVRVLAILPTHQDCRQSVGGATTVNHPTYPPVVAPAPALGSLAGNEEGNRKPWYVPTDILGRPITPIEERRIFD